MKLNITRILISVVIAASVSSCSSLTKKMIGYQEEIETPLAMKLNSTPDYIGETDKQIAVKVTSSQSPDGMYNDEAVEKKLRKFMPKVVRFTPSVQEFAQSATQNYMERKGFELSQSADYRLLIDVKTLKYAYTSNTAGDAVTVLSYRFVNEAGETIIPSTTVNATVTLSSNETYGFGMGRAYGEALAKIDWRRIARSLKVNDSPKDEKNAKVTGQGTTALENSVIRWFINSTPQGADVSWRVISSTPEVSNTNSNYVGTTPYETTESFDIKGLTYNNSGNVQIEVTCERPGYLPQKKRFNVRQAIDQKEISAKFNLVKDE